MDGTSKRQLMDSVDKAWLEMDRETNLMIINGVMQFDGSIDYLALRMAFEEQLAKNFPRFRQRVVGFSSGSGRAFWEDDPYFDVRSHLLHISLPEPGTTATLQRLFSDLMSTALDRSKPLWRVYLIDNYEGGSVLFLRVHHCLADGISLVRVILSMMETANGDILLPAGNLPLETEAPRRGFFRSAARLAGRTAVGAVKLSEFLVSEGIETVRNPSEVVETMVSAGLNTAAGAAVLARLIISSPDRESIFRGQLGTSKRVLWSEPVDLQLVKNIGYATGSTVNDVLFAALTGALGEFMAEEGDTIEASDLRAMVPVNLRTAEEPLQLGNQFGMVYLSLPVSIDDPLQRLFEVKRRMDALKRSPEAVVVYQVLNLLGALPGELAAHAVDIFAAKASAVLTNVPGPQETLYFDGVPMRRMMFWVPQSGDIGLGISIISYDGHVALGIVIDEKLVGTPERILDGFLSEVDVLAREARIVAFDGS